MFEQLTIATITLLLIVSLHGAGLLSLGRLIQVLEHSVYFSTITYATIGHDDEGLMKNWRLAAAMEGMNGVILLGWSTAFFVSLAGRFGHR